MPQHFGYLLILMRHADESEIGEVSHSPKLPLRWEWKESTCVTVTVGTVCWGTRPFSPWHLEAPWSSARSFPYNHRLSFKTLASSLFALRTFHRNTGFSKAVSSTKCKDSVTVILLQESQVVFCSIPSSKWQPLRLFAKFRDLNSPLTNHSRITSWPNHRLFSIQTGYKCFRVRIKIPPQSVAAR